MRRQRTIARLSLIVILVLVSLVPSSSLRAQGTETDTPIEAASNQDTSGDSGSASGAEAGQTIHPDNSVVSPSTVEETAETPTAKPSGSPATTPSPPYNLASDVGNWVALQVGATLGINTARQLVQSGWDPGKIDWSQTTAFLGQSQFWNGVGGAFIGKLAGTAIAAALPGGPFFKTLITLGGINIGRTIGSGGFGTADWTGLAMVTLGATCGSTLGTSVGGAIGATLGTIIGTLVTQSIYDSIKTPQTLASSPDSSQGEQAASSSQAAFTGVTARVSQTSGDEQSVRTGPQGDFSTDVASITDRMTRVYGRFLRHAQAGERDLAESSLREYQLLRSEFLRSRMGTPLP